MDFSDKLLIASPAIEDDSIFSRALVYISEDSPEQTLGFIVNKPSDLNMREFVKSTNLSKILSKHAAGDQPLFIGGPVHTTKLHIMYSDDADPAQRDLLGAAPSIRISTSERLLRAIDSGEGPERYMFILGCSSWEEGQLVREFREDTWILANSEPDIVFDADIDDRLPLAARSMGFNLNMMVAARR